jgi:hypothetical protein
MMLSFSLVAHRRDRKWGRIPDTWLPPNVTPADPADGCAAPQGAPMLSGLSVIGF